MLLQRFPFAVPVGSPALEVVLKSEESDLTSAATLQRLSVSPGDANFVVDGPGWSYYGPAGELADCPYVLAYDGAGILSHIGMRESPESEWVTHTFPAELRRYHAAYDLLDIQDVLAPPTSGRPVERGSLPELMPERVSLWERGIITPREMAVIALQIAARHDPEEIESYLPDEVRSDVHELARALTSGDTDQLRIWDGSSVPADELRRRRDETLEGAWRWYRAFEDC